MYRAKALGRNQAQLFTASMNERYVRRLAIEQSLHHALERRERSEEHTSELQSPAEIYTLSLHDALPISRAESGPALHREHERALRPPPRHRAEPAPRPRAPR